MQRIKFSKEEKKAIVGRIQEYFSEELEQRIGDIPAELLLEFFSEQMGGFYYNRGLYDAQAALASRMDDLTDAIYALEQRGEATR